MRRGILNSSILLIATLMASAAASAQDGTIAIDAPDQKLVPGPVTRISEIQQRLASFKGALKDGAKAMPEGESRVLPAVIMEVKGRCQWRADEQASWKKAAVNDSIRAGAWIRTGLNSTLTLRCGLNSTVLVDSNSRVRLPQLIQDGDVLRTVVTVNRGRADIQVDRVGLINDFSVLTPSGSLAVKGTGMGVQYDGFEGTTVVGARHNRMNAIEMRYFTREGYAWMMSGGAVSTQSVPNPATVAALETQPDPSLQAYESEDSGSYNSVADQALSSTDTSTETTRIVLAQEQERVTESIITDIEQEVIAGILTDQQAILLAAAQEAEAAAQSGLLDEEIAAVIEEEIEEIIEDEIDDHDDPVIDESIFDAAGYQQYFAIMNSPSDRGFLAATIVLDLVDENTTLGDFTFIDPIMPTTGEERRQIPVILEPTLNQLGGTETGARSEVTAYAPLPASGPLHDMYFSMINYGVGNPQWYSVGGTAPTEADMEIMLGFYDNYIGNVPSLTGQEVVSRQAFVSSLEAIYQTQTAPGFSLYGQELLQRYVPTYSGGGIGGFEGKNIQIGQ